MKYLLFIISVCCLTELNAQKRFSEGTIVYSVAMISGGVKTPGETVSLQMIKGGHFRSELTSDVGKTTTIYDLSEAAGAILREFGTQKIMIPLGKREWDLREQKKGIINFNFLDETKEILGYTCSKAVAEKADGTSIVLFFTKGVIPENKDMELQFQQLPGFVLEYESMQGDFTVSYKAKFLNFDPVPIQKFDLPKSGYRILEYTEKTSIK
jgi:GLPGLI family protein